MVILYFNCKETFRSISETHFLNIQTDSEVTTVVGK